MYYKITDKESEAYKLLHAMRTEELEIEAVNREAINKKIGFVADAIYGHHGQQNFRRVSQPCGIQCIDPNKVDLKTWRLEAGKVDVYVPNRRTKSGREMAEFLSNGLLSSWHKRPLEILNVSQFRLKKFRFPFVEICGDVVVVYLDDHLDPTDSSLVEITRREFNELFSLNA